jgi:hypothetical protein
MLPGVEMDATMALSGPATPLCQRAEMRGSQLHWAPGYLSRGLSMISTTDASTGSSIRSPFCAEMRPLLKNRHRQQQAFARFLTFLL